MNKRWAILWFLGVLFFLTQISPAEEQAVELRQKDKDFFGLGQWKQDLKKSAPWLELGGDFRFRVVYDEARKLDKQATGHDRLNTRYRVRVWAKIKQSDDLEFNIRLMTEPRYYHRPPSMDKQLTYEEAMLDILNMKWKNAFGLPWEITAGRQEIKLGSGLLIRDGTPLDGGNTYFFDALRFTYECQGRNTTLDLIWVDNHGDSAKRIKPFNDKDNDLIEQDERGLIVYASDKSRKKTQLDGYFIYKNDHHRNRSSGTEGNIYTFGTLIKGDISEHWKYQLEFAPQFGHKNGKELNAFATSNQLAYHFNDVKKNRIHFGYEYLSGNDDPDKNFDRLWGRVDDLWSKLYQCSIDSIDGRSADSSNLHRLNVGWVTEPSEKLQIETNYHLLFADDNTSAGGTNGLSKSGNFRGQLFRTEIKYNVSKQLCHRVEFELFCPGDFYNNDRNDMAIFFRYAIQFTW